MPKPSDDRADLRGGESPDELPPGLPFPFHSSLHGPLLNSFFLFLCLSSLSIHRRIIVAEVTSSTTSQRAQATPFNPQTSHAHKTQESQATDICDYFTTYMSLRRTKYGRSTSICLRIHFLCFFYDGPSVPLFLSNKPANKPSNQINNGRSKSRAFQESRSCASARFFSDSTKTPPTKA